MKVAAGDQELARRVTREATERWVRLELEARTAAECRHPERRHALLAELPRVQVGVGGLPPDFDMLAATDVYAPSEHTGLVATDSPRLVEAVKRVAVRVLLCAVIAVGGVYAAEWAWQVWGLR